MPPLARALAAVREREEYDRWLPEYEAVEAERDALAQEVADVYPKLAEPMVDLFQHAAAVDAKVQQVTGMAANLVNEPRRLLGVELTARGLKGFTGNNPSLAERVQLPEFKEGSKMVWPPRTVPPTVLIAKNMMRAMSHMPSPADNSPATTRRRTRAGGMKPNATRTTTAT